MYKRNTLKVLSLRKKVCRLSLNCDSLAVEWEEPTTIVSKILQAQFTQSNSFTYT